MTAHVPGHTHTSLPDLSKMFYQVTADLPPSSSPYFQKDFQENKVKGKEDIRENVEREETSGISLSGKQVLEFPSSQGEKG